MFYDMMGEVRTVFYSVKKGYSQERKEKNYMKKKLMAVLLAGMMILAAGCGNKGKVTIGEYKGLVLTGVSQEEVDAELTSLMEAYAELVEVDRAAQEGDTVNINYVGLLNGEAFEGGTDDSEEGYNLELGSNSFIDGFEEGLIGAVAGEKRDLNLTFLENYGKEELNGQAVVFQVTVNAVQTELVPKLTDEFIAEKVPEYPSVEAYTNALRENMNKNAYYNQITEQIMASSEVEKYNEAEVLLRKEQLISDYTAQASYYGSFYGFDTETALTYFFGFESLDAFKEEMGAYAYEVEKNAMILAEIAKKEGIAVSEEEYTAQVAEMAEYYGYADVAEFENTNGKDNIKESILAEEVMNFIIDNAVITEAQ